MDELRALLPWRRMAIFGRALGVLIVAGGNPAAVLQVQRGQDEQRRGHQGPT